MPARLLKIGPPALECFKASAIQEPFQIRFRIQILRSHAGLIAFSIGRTGEEH